MDLGQTIVNLYPLSGYSFGEKDHVSDTDIPSNARLDKLKEDYESSGMRVSVEGALLVHDHGHPHILMIQLSNSNFALPGGILKPGEEETSGLKTRLNELLGSQGEETNDFDVGELLGIWWRPNLESHMYPYLPAHITRPKEMKKTYLIHLPEKKMLVVPKNLKLLAIPLFELYDNKNRYGDQLAALPHILARFNFMYQ